MNKKSNKAKDNLCTNKPFEPEGCGYILGAIGAAIYFVSTTTGFWAGVLGILKALIWPLFLVLESFRFFLG